MVDLFSKYKDFAGQQLSDKMLILKDIKSDPLSFKKEKLKFNIL